MQNSHRLYLSLGSNLGDREKLLNDALRLLAERVGSLSACSAFHETLPWGFHSPRLFLNAAACFLTPLDSAERLLEVTQEIERQLGRERKSGGGNYEDRTIDIDLLLLDDRVLSTPRLALPHPLLHRRRFVLQPLCEIAPRLVHPTLRLTMEQLLEKLNEARITRLDHCQPAALSAVNALLPQLSPHAAPHTQASLAALLANGQTRLYLLADEEGAFCGMATLCLAASPTGLKAWVEDVVVDRSCRGRGYARQLLRHLEDEAVSAGAKSLNLTSRPEREAANRLYASLGYEKRQTNVYRKTF